MKFKFFSLATILIFCMGFMACTQADKINGKQIGKVLQNTLAAPEKIVIYDKGSTKEISISNAQFNKIVELTNKRFHDKLSTASDVINDSTMGDIRKDGLGIEFFYSSEQQLAIEGDGFKAFKYNKLYFQLTSDRSGNKYGSSVHTLQYGDKEHYMDCSRGPLKYSQELIKIVEGLK